MMTIFDKKYISRIKLRVFKLADKMINIEHKNYFSEYFLHPEELLEKLKNIRKNNKKIGLCTGSFDLLHPGHLSHLISAKKLCDVLIVGVAHDDYSSNKKPFSGRPIFSHFLRGFMVSQLKSVDYVILDDCSDKIVYQIKPDIYIKGIDYSSKENPGIIHVEKLMRTLGGKMIFTETEKLSTTSIIDYIKREVK